MLIKLLVMHHLYDDNDLPGMERFFWRYHAPEVMQFAPKMTRYVNFRAGPPPPGAEEYGYYNYHLHENCRIVDDGPPSSRGLLNFTAEHGPMEVCLAILPLQPTEDFFGADLRHDEKTILRWVTGKFVTRPSPLNWTKCRSPFLRRTSTQYAALVAPGDLAVDKSGNLYIADWTGNRVRKVSGGKISTIAGTGVNG